MVVLKLPRLDTPARVRIKTLRLITLVVLPLGFIVVAALVLALILKSGQASRDILKDTAVTHDARQVYALVHDAETGQRNYLLTGQKEQLQPYLDAVNGLPVALNNLARSAEAASVGRDEIAPLRTATRAALQDLYSAIALQQGGLPEKAVLAITSRAEHGTIGAVRMHVARIDAAADGKVKALHQAWYGDFVATLVVAAILLVGLIAFMAFCILLAFQGLRERDRSVRELAAAKLEADLAEFLANMSHELRTPLNAILGFSDVIRSELHGALGSPRYQQYATHIHDSGMHLLDLINDVLDLSKITAGKMELHEQDIAISDLLSDVLALVKGRAKDVQLSEGPWPGLPHIRADYRHLKQILLNLLTNAIKFTPPGGQIVVRAAVGQDIRLIVSDTGIGMTQTELEQAMSQYGQVDSKVARQHRGTGLGLPICKSLALLHGGALEIVSKPDAGTIVSLVLPASRIVTAPLLLAS
jgi:signal transduction histidine kinase